MSKLKLANVSNFTTAKFSHEASNLPIGPVKLRGPTVLPSMLRGYDLESVHLHGTYMQTSEEYAGEPHPVVL